MNRRKALRNGLTVCAAAMAPTLWATGTGNTLRTWERLQLEATRKEMLQLAATVTGVNHVSSSVLTPHHILERSDNRLVFRNPAGNTVELIRTEKRTYTRFS